MANRFRRKLRGSQAVTTYGPGGIVDLRDESVMLAGLDYWRPHEDTRISEPNLESVLGVRCFHGPPPAGEWFQHAEGSLPIVLFPEWLACPQCGRLAKYSTFVGVFQGTQAIRCQPCNRPVYPARLIVACRAGHIDDFPWEWWVHERQGNRCSGTAALKLRSLGRTASLGDLLVHCTTCKANVTLAGATFPENLKDRECSGRRPWLRDEEECREKPIPLQRGASNVYFPIAVSGISIPPWSKTIQTVIGRHWEMLGNLATRSPDALGLTIEAMNLPGKTGYSVEDIIGAVRQRLANEAPERGRISESELRFQEHLALRVGHGGGPTDGDFEVRETAVHSRLGPFVQRVSLVTRLREVRALRGFTRVMAPDPTNRVAVRPAPISREWKPWLPAIEVRGEGIYLELNETPLSHWSQQAAIRDRAARLQDTYEEMCRQRHWDAGRRITPRLLLVHSLAHLLIRQLSVDCGYSSASLRERLYVFEPEAEAGRAAVAGLLLYTGTVDSDGSLGGLVRQGLPERLLRTVENAIESASWCASDPLCLESEGQGQGALNLAACHACLLVSETSCEEFNRLLDRAMLIGPPGKPDAGFFAGLVQG